MPKAISMYAPWAVAISLGEKKILTCRGSGVEWIIR